MNKKIFGINGIIGASKFIGYVEAESKEEAEKIANTKLDFDPPSLCYHCSTEVELGDMYEIEAFEVKRESLTKKELAALAGSTSDEEE